jgi:hypothetical protein
MNANQIANVAQEPLRYIAATIRIGLTSFILLTAVMWGINIAGVKEWNFGFLFLIPLIGVWVSTSQIGLPTVLGVSAVAPDTALKVKGIVISVVYHTMLMAAFLASWSFEEKPSTFFPFAGALLLLLMWQLHYSDSVKLAKPVQYWYIVAIIVMALAGSMGYTTEKVKEEVTNTFSSCSDEIPNIKADMYITISRDCDVIVDQVLMRDTSFSYVLVDPNLVGREREFVVFTQEYEGKQNLTHVKLIPQQSAFDTLGVTKLVVMIKAPAHVRPPLGTPSVEPAAGDPLAAALKEALTK